MELKLHRKFGLGMLAFLLALGVQAQNTVSGIIKEKATGEPLPGVNIINATLGGGTSTGVDGTFKIKAAQGDTLQISFIGFKTVKHVVKGSGTIAIALEDNSSVLDQVVVVGYGSTTKKELTGATSGVKGDAVTKLNVPRMDAALQGQLAGVSISTNSGSPGGSSIIRIRGLSTFGDNDPLILVDGIVYDSEGLNALNPQDIASIDVLKDGTAGIYGVRAANGVIVIETKKGSKNSAAQWDVSSYYGVQRTSKTLNLLNANEYAVIKNNAFANGGQDIPFANTSLGAGTDWQEAVFQTAPIQQVNVGVQGGNNKTSYSIGGSYFAQDGIVGGEKANFERYNARVNIATDLSDRMELTSVLLYTHEKRNALPENGIGSVLYNTINAYPTEPIRESDGSYSYLSLVNDIINPLAQMENTYNTSWVNKFVGKEELRYQFTENLSWTNRFAYNYAAVDGKVFSPLTWYGPGKPQNTALNADLDPTIVEIAEGVEIERGASVFENRDSYVDLTFESFLNYEQKWGTDHRLRSTLGTSVFSRRGEGLNATAFNIPNNSIEFADISANQAPGGFLNNTGSFLFQERLLSAFLRAEYSFKDRYLLSAIVRRDGSSKFGINNRYGTFPVISGGWIFSEEDFFNVKGVDFAKLRLSYGISGNDQIPNFAFRALLNGEGAYVWDNVILSGVAIGRASNPDLKWESTRQFNAGLDLSMLSRFDVTVNYFIKNTRDLLFQPDVSGILGTYGPGGYPPFVNAGDVQNKGIEIEVGYRSKPIRNVLFSVDFNATALQNEVLRVPEGVDFIPGAAFGVGGSIATRFEEGFPIGYFIGYQTDGIWQSQAEIDASPVQQDGAKPGDLRFVDQNGDGVISFGNDEDKTMIGSPIPDFTFGLNLSARYKGFDISANLYAAIGQEIIRNYERQQPYANQLDYVIERWVVPGDVTDVPRVTTGATRNTEFSDFFVEDGSFARLRNVQLGYQLPRAISQKFGFQSLRVYVSANNLLTITRYMGYDPDIGAYGGALSAGVDYGFYPQPTTIMGGFNVKF